MNSSSKINVSNYTFNELKKCIRPFEEYKEDHGETQPVNTGYSIIDNSGNWLASCFGMKTNQHYVTKILNILNGTEKEFESKRYTFEPFTVYTTLEKIKIIYDEMIKLGIKTGKTMDALAILFQHFNYPYQETGSKYDELCSSIFHQLKGLNTVPENSETESLPLQSSSSYGS